MNQEQQKYWNTFYEKSADKQMSSCSDFCRFVMDMVKNEEDIKYVLDCGCGDGRDSMVLSTVYEVHGIDSCGFVPKCDGAFRFSTADFTTFDKRGYHLIYSRFTFHSISDAQQQTFLESIQPGSVLAIETRSDKGEVEDVHHGKSHYRNYTNIDNLMKMLKDNNFETVCAMEQRDFARYKDENPICIRVVCRKLCDEN